MPSSISEQFTSIINAINDLELEIGCEEKIYCVKPSTGSAFLVKASNPTKATNIAGDYIKFRYGEHRSFAVMEVEFTEGIYQI